MGTRANTISSSENLVKLSFNNSDTLREARNRIEVERKKVEEKQKPMKLSYAKELVFRQCFADISERIDFIQFRTKCNESSNVSRSLLRFSSCFLSGILSDIQQDSQEIIIYLADVQKKTLDKVVDLIKTGETKISEEEEMDQILSAAEILGLDHFKGNNLEMRRQNTTSMMGEYFEHSGDEDDIKLGVGLGGLKEEDQIQRICGEDERRNSGSWSAIKKENNPRYGIINVRNDLKADYCPISFPLSPSSSPSPPPPSPSPSPPPSPINNCSRRKSKSAFCPPQSPNEIESLEAQVALKDMKENTQNYKDTEDLLHFTKDNIPKKHFLIRFEKEGKTPEDNFGTGIIEKEYLRELKKKDDIKDLRAKSQPTEIRREKSQGTFGKGFEIKRIKRNSGEKYWLEEERNIGRNVGYLDKKIEPAPVSSLAELQYIYDYSLHQLCQRRHRRIDTCPARLTRLQPCCGRAHSRFMECSGAWKSLQYIEDIALRWPTTRRRQEMRRERERERDGDRRKRRPEEYESDRLYKRHKEREY